MKNKTMKTITFVTGNSYKFKVAKKAVGDSGIHLKQKKLHTPEIQSDSVEEIAEFSARWASDVLKRPVVVSDGGCFIEALGGFPGPYIKYVDQWFTHDDLLRLMRNKKNRRVIWKDCLAYCEPGRKPMVFTSVFKGTLAQKPGKNPYRKYYGWPDALYVPDGFSRSLSELPTEEYLAYWSNEKEYTGWQKLMKYLKK